MKKLDNVRILWVRKNRLMKIVRSLIFILAFGGLTACQSGGGQKDANPQRYLPPRGERMVEMSQRVDDPATSRTYPVFHFGSLEWLGRNLSLQVANSWCYDDRDMNCRDYGQLYTPESAQYACSALGGGWRLPTITEWKTILRAHGGFVDENQKRVGPSPEAALINLTNDNLPFRAKTSGFRNVYGEYMDMGVQTFYWTSTEKDLYQTNYAIALEEKGIGFKVTALDKKAGGYCRCVRPYYGQ